jgi:hypothetical protein
MPPVLPVTPAPRTAVMSPAAAKSAVLPEQKKNSEIHVITLLPSDFRSYDVKQIDVRALNMGELKYLTSVGLTKRNLVELYKNVILNYDVNKLTWFDFTYIVTHIAIFTLDSVFWVFAERCANCNEILHIKVSKDRFVLFEDMQALKGYPVNAAVGGQSLKFGFLTVEKYLNTLDKIADMDEHLRSIYALAAMVTNMDTDAAFNLFKGITDYEDMELLTKISELLYHGPLPVEWTCEHCGHTDKYKVDLEVSTVTPFRDDAKSLDARISFGNAS